MLFKNLESFQNVNFCPVFTNRQNFCGNFIDHIVWRRRAGKIPKVLSSEETLTGNFPRSKISIRKWKLGLRRLENDNTCKGLKRELFKRRDATTWHLSYQLLQRCYYCKYTTGTLYFFITFYHVTLVLQRRI